MSGWPFDPLPMFGFDIVDADPPWRFEVYSEKGEAKSPMAQYECMNMEQIKALPVGHLVGSDSWCFLWTIAPMLDCGFDVLRAWGFQYVSRINWQKKTINGKNRMGPGYVVRTLDETILIGKCGSPQYCNALPSSFPGLAREHSRKPDEYYEMLDSRFLTPSARRVRLFARESRPGWSSWGNEATKFDEVAA